jgi:hypothetical protein
MAGNLECVQVPVTGTSRAFPNLLSEVRLAEGYGSEGNEEERDQKRHAIIGAVPEHKASQRLPTPQRDDRSCTAIFLALFGHNTGRDGSLDTTYPSLDSVDEAVVVNQILLFQYLYRSKDDLGEGLG